MQGKKAGMARAAAMTAIGIAATGLPGSLVIAPAFAQTIQAPAQAQLRAFTIPPQPLVGALARFTETSGVQFFFDAAIARNVQSPGVTGSLTAEAALQQLLTGTGLTYRFTNPTTVTLVEVPKGGSAAVLPVIGVEGRRTETAWGPVEGYAATRSGTGTKTDTPLLETPQTISVITREQMDEQKPRQIGETMRYTAGVRAESGGLQMQHDGIQLRGFTQFAGYLYRDGTRELPQAFLGFHAPEPYNMERVEVIKGPASILYGQNSPGGLVNMVTKRPTERPVNEVEVQGGSFERKQISADIGGAATGNLSYRLVALGRDSDTQVDYVEDNRAFLAGGLTWRGSDTTVTLLMDHQRDDSLYLYGMPAAGTVLSNPNGQIPINRYIGEPGFDYTYMNKTSFSALTEHSLDQTWTLRQTLRYSDHDYDALTTFIASMQANQRVANRTAQRRLAAGRVITADQHAEAKFSTGPLNHTTLLGFDYQRSSLDVISGNGAMPTLDLFAPVYGAAAATPAFTNGSDQRIIQQGVYAQDQVKLDNWVLLFGGRQDRATTDTTARFTNVLTKQDDRAFTGRAGLLYLFDSGIAPYVSYAESFEPVSGTAFGGKPFDPETGRQKEIGLKYQPKGYDSFVTASAFDLRRQNVTTSDPANPGFSIQTGEVTSRGFELEGKASLNRELDMIATYTYQDVEVTKSNNADLGKRPARVPEQMASLWADYTLRSGELSGLGFGAGARYIGSTYGTSTNAYGVPAFTLFDAAVHYDWQNFRFSLNAANLLDQENFSCGSLTSCNYGIGRTIIGAVRYRW